MNKKIKKAISTLVMLIIITIAIITTFFIIKSSANKKEINKVQEEYSEENIQNKLKTQDIETVDEIMLQIDEENVIGIIKIEKINFEGMIYKGTSKSTLNKGVGHIESSPYFDGNVCLAAHNSRRFWKELYTLEEDDLISYTSFLGKREYRVKEIKQINETDWTLLQNTDKNLLTLITCVKGKPSLRLAVQAVEVK